MLVTHRSLQLVAGYFCSTVNLSTLSRQKLVSPFVLSLSVDSEREGERVGRMQMIVVTHEKE